MINRKILHRPAERFIRALPPEPRRRLVKAIKALPAGDTKALEGRLAGYFRLRVAGYRVIFADTTIDGVRMFDCLCAERRSIVYELFAAILVEKIVHRRPE